MKDRRKWLWVAVIAIAAWICAKGARTIMKATTGRSKSYGTTRSVIEQHAENLILETGAAEVNIVQGGINDAYLIETNIQDLDIDDDERILSIHDGSSMFMDEKAWIRITIPDGHVFNDVEIDTGAGTLDIEKLTTDYLDMDIGAGEVTINQISVPKQAGISTGAGRVFIGNCLMMNADLDLGTGEVTVNGELMGESKVNCGIGKVDLVLTGDDYTIDFDSGVGEANLNGQVMHEGTYGNGRNIIEIDGGIGEISVRTE